MAAYSYATAGAGWQMIPCMVSFLAEVKACVAAGLLDVTNLGQLGDAVHKTEPTSRHNPARAPDGQWYVCAADFGGPDYTLLAEFHAQRYREHDARLYRYGFSQRGDGRGLSWFDGGWKWTGRDQGHCHFDVNMFGPQLGANWYVPALAITATWGLENWLRNRLGQAPTDNTDTFITNPVQEDDMPVLITAPGRPQAVLTGGNLVSFVDPTTVSEGTDGAKLPMWKVAAADYDRMRFNGNGAGTVYRLDADPATGVAGGYAAQAAGAPAPHAVGTNEQAQRYLDGGYSLVVVDPAEWERLGGGLKARP